MLHRKSEINEKIECISPHACLKGNGRIAEKKHAHCHTKSPTHHDLIKTKTVKFTYLLIIHKCSFLKHTLK